MIAEDQTRRTLVPFVPSWCPLTHAVFVHLPLTILTGFPISRSEGQPSGADALFVKGTEILNLPDQLKALLKRRPKTEPAKNSQQRRSV